MATRGFLPAKDLDLLAWSLNFATRINAAPVPLGLTSALASAYQDDHDAFADAMQGVEPGVRNKSSVAVKNACRETLKDNARLLASIINGQASVTDAMKYDLGLTVRATPSPRPIPAFAPIIDVLSVNGRTVSYRIHGPDLTRRGLPVDVDGISIFSCISEEKPTTPAQFKFEANTTKTTFDIVFPDTVVPGKTVWLTAMFFNERKESGPGADPARATIGFGVSMAA